MGGPTIPADCRGLVDRVAELAEDAGATPSQLWQRKYPEITYRPATRTLDQIVSQFQAEGFSDLQIHASNTAAAIRFPEAHSNMVRIGLGLYGLYPSEAVQRIMDLDKK